MKKNSKKNVVAGLGEIGKPILQLISRKTLAIGYDINPKLVRSDIEKYSDIKTSILHVCIPFNSNFLSSVETLFNKFSPEMIVIHSTISPGTTDKIQEKLPIPIIYSATRGVHSRMLQDLKYYTKFFSISSKAPKLTWASSCFSKLLKSCGVKTKRLSTPVTLELAKIVCDTSYLGWLVNYAQISNVIAREYGVNYDEMWSFSDEIHKKLGNRPKMFPGYIGGHCVIPNLELIHNKTLDLIKQMNEDYSKKVKNSKTIAKKYKAKLNR